MSATAARAWDAEYARGRFAADAPEPFVDDVLAAARAHGVGDGIYVGCGNGRNYLPLCAGGLRLTGLDVSATAIEQLAARAPQHAGDLVVGDLGSLSGVRDRRYGLVVAIQVLQHGDRATAHAHVRRAQARVAAGGLMAVRVNAAATDVVRPHALRERGPGEAFTVRYLAGPKRGLDVHFFDGGELDELFAAGGFAPLLAPRLRAHERAAEDGGGRWAQWEAIWRREAT
ncbi:MAG TPA: methyltransferase domain-containing protein [Conexibacter sp.]|nr:methyltransferase domain-containing protein [Conexibacter sp.]